MISSLLRKEWREHRWALFALWGLGAIMIALLAISAIARPEQGSPLVSVRAIAAIMGSLAAIYASHRLMVREYGNRTQLFLTSLPVGRGAVLIIKLLLGALVLLVPVAAAVAVLGKLANDGLAVTPRFLALVFLRGGSFVLLGWALFALAGIVGRYRNPLLLLTVVGLFALDQATTFDISTAAPILLLGDDFGLERFVAPWRALAITWALTAGCFALTFVLATARDGTVAELLSDKMSHREKVFIACAFVAVFFGIYLLDEAKPKPRFEMHEARSGQQDGFIVAVAPGVDVSPERADELALKMARSVAELSAYLKLEDHPPLTLVSSHELDPSVFQQARVDNADGVVLRANFGAADFDWRAFEAFAVARVLRWHSRGLLANEERRWLLDGFASLWAHRDDGADPAAIRAAFAGLRGFGSGDVSAWLRTRERLGPCAADAVAQLGVEELARQLGEDRFRAAMQRSLGVRPPAWGWATLTLVTPFAALREQGGDPAQLLERWTARIQTVTDAHRPELEGLAALRPSLELVRSSASSFSLRHALPGHPHTLLFERLGPFDGELDEVDFQRERVAASTAEPAILAQSLSRGQRWAFAVETDAPALGCPARLVFERRELE